MWILFALASNLRKAARSIKTESIKTALTCNERAFEILLRRGKRAWYSIGHLRRLPRGTRFSSGVQNLRFAGTHPSTVSFPAIGAREETWPSSMAPAALRHYTASPLRKRILRWAIRDRVSYPCATTTRTETTPSLISRLGIWELRTGIKSSLAEWSMEWWTFTR